MHLWSFYSIEGFGECETKFSEKCISSALGRPRGGSKSTYCQEEKFDEVCFWQREPPNFRVHATMHLIMILIRWLVGFFGGGRSVAGRVWSCALSEAGMIRFGRDMNDAYSSGIGGKKVNLILADLKFNGLLGRRLALAVISPHGRSRLRVNPYQPDYFVVETAILSSNISPPAPQAWG
jgi:hypothetical protein